MILYLMEKNYARVCVINAPCKINLHLSVGQRRGDGFHGIESIFVPLALSDTLHFERCGAGEDTLSVRWETAEQPIASEENLVAKAVALFRSRTDFAPALRIRLDKRIPAGAGLGGASSDAASTLLAMNQLAGQPLCADEMREMAAVLGSDVPFFLSNGAAFVSGRGERVESVKPPEDLWVLLVKPPFSSDTAAAYRLLDEARERASAGQKFSKEQFAKDKLANDKLPKEVLSRALCSPPQNWPFSNDFLPMFLAQGGEQSAAYRAILEELRNAGALFTGLSGSGSCCFGIFDSQKTIKNAKNALSCSKNDVILTFFLAQEPNSVVKY